MNNDTLAWMRWILIPGLGLKRSNNLLDHIDSPESLFQHPERWPIPDSIKRTIREMNLLGEQHPVHRRALEQCTWAEHKNHHLILFTSDLYPENLTHLDDSPLALWVHGDPAILKRKQVGIVGSRHASPNALRNAAYLSKELVRSSLVITSGGALGIDSACHEAAISEQGETIAVLGCGVDVIYPKKNRTLFSAITEKGALVSEYPLKTQPKQGHFPRRNRLISGLSDSIVVVEAALKSGSLVTAKHALEQGKDIYAMPGDVMNPNSEGCHKLIQDGAFLLTKATDITEQYGFDSPKRASGKIELPDYLNPVQLQIIDQLKQQSMPLDMLGHQLKMAVHQLLEPILELEMEGLIEQNPGGYTLSEFD